MSLRPDDGLWSSRGLALRSDARSGRAAFVAMMEPTDLRMATTVPSLGGVIERGSGVTLQSDKRVRDRSWYEQ